MDFHDLIANMDAATCAALRRAIELGKFPDGRRLTDRQRELCLEAVIAWEHRNLPEHERTGYIDRGSKAKDESCASHDPAHDHEHGQPLVIRDHKH